MAQSKQKRERRLSNSGDEYSHISEDGTVWTMESGTLSTSGVVQFTVQYDPGSESDALLDSLTTLCRTFFDIAEQPTRSKPASRRGKSQTGSA